MLLSLHTYACIRCSKNELDQAAEYVEQACKLSEEANVTDEQPAGKEALGILSTSHAKAGDIYTLLEQDELAISHYSKAIGAKEKLARLVSSEEPSGILQKALLLTKLAEILQRAARKRAYDAKTLMDSLRQCDQSSVSERDQNVVEYVSSSIASILGSGE